MAIYLKNSLSKRLKVLLVCFDLDSDIDAVNCGFKTIDIYTLLKKELHKCLHMKTGSKYKKLTPRGIETNVEHANNLTQKLCGCGIDPFSNDAPRHHRSCSCFRYNSSTRIGFVTV